MTVPSCGNSMEFYDMMVSRLGHLIQPRILEMGVFYGRGLIYLAKRFGPGTHIYGVDKFVTADMPYHPAHIHTDIDFYAGCLENLFAAEVAHRITLVALPSSRAAKLFDDCSLDCVFIDGDHSYEAVLNDIATWKPKVKLGGYLAGDDYVQPWGVIKAVDEVLPQRNLMGQTWWVKL